MTHAVAATFDFVREKLATAATPRIAIVLGSGLGGLAKLISDAVTVDYGDVPGFVPPSVEGHAGRIIAGRLAGTSIVAFAGRFHMYEGHGPEMPGLLVRVAHAW